MSFQDKNRERRRERRDECPFLSRADRKTHSRLRLYNRQKKRREGRAKKEFDRRACEERVFTRTDASRSRAAPMSFKKCNVRLQKKARSTRLRSPSRLQDSFDFCLIFPSHPHCSIFSRASPGNVSTLSKGSTDTVTVAFPALLHSTFFTVPVFSAPWKKEKKPLFLMAT